MIASSSDRAADAAALLAGAGPLTVLDAAGGSAEIDGAALDERGRRLAAGLERLGIGRGDRVGCWLPNSVAYLTVLSACARLGAVAVAVNTRFRAAEVQDIVGRSGCRALFVHPGFVGIDTEAILSRMEAAAMPTLEVVVPVVGTVDTPWAVVPFLQLAESEPSSTDNAHRDAPFAVFTTSGTTSAPKLVMHRQSSIVDHAYDVVHALGISVADTSLITLPLCGVFGFTSFTSGAAAGGAQVLTATFDAAQAATAVSDHGVTVMNATDDMVHRMLEHGGDWSGIRHTGFGRFNNALDDLPQRAAAAGWTLVGLYGMSEVQALYAHRSVDLPFEERTRSGGRLVSPSADARVVDPDTGEPLPVGVEGELQLKGPSRFAGYLRDGGDGIDEELTSRHHTDDGWFRTGDLARMESPVAGSPAGRSFAYIARMGDVLRLGGFLVSPLEIEDQILSRPGIDAVQVVAVDTERGPQVVAFVICTDEAFHEHEIIEHCRAQLAAFKVPRRVLPLAEFPMTESANGMKIQKVKLRELAAAQLTS